jgi:hypothetical protein
VLIFTAAAGVAREIASILFAHFRGKTAGPIRQRATLLLPCVISRAARWSRA